MWVLTDKRLIDAVNLVAGQYEANDPIATFCHELVIAIQTVCESDTNDAITAPAAVEADTNADDFSMPFGKYKGTLMSKVPPSYWIWLVSQPQPVKHAAVARWLREHVVIATPKP